MPAASFSESLLGVRLDRLLGATAASAAAATGVGLIGPTTCAEAAIIYSGPVNIVIPDTVDGLYVNLVTGASSGDPATAPTGWDINPYSSVAGSFNLWGATANTWLVNGTAFVHNTGTLVNSAQTFGRPGAGTNLATSQITLNASNYFGVQFNNEGTAANNYGWVKMTFGATSATRSITEYAYENTGAAISVGQISAVPEPSTICLLATGAVGLFAARRRRLAA